MITVTIELNSAHGRHKDRTLGILVISNDDTGTSEIGNYKWTLSHAGMYFGKRREPFKSGTVKGFKRSLSPYRLVYRCLKEAREV